jgi:putative flippase GtrA
MSTLIRWCRFNMVGAIGMVVQLALLAWLNGWTKRHYLLATAAAIELTVVHNFVWHLNYTWRDRRDGSAVLRRFIQFNTSNGLISMLGNLALMRLLVQGLRTPVLAANCLAVLVCSLINFCLGNKWAFAPSGYTASNAVAECPPGR